MRQELAQSARSLTRPRPSSPWSQPASSASTTASRAPRKPPPFAACGNFAPAGPSNTAVWWVTKCKHCQQPKHLHD
eukprot:g28370.t1